jgi:hypothetical protein
MFTISVNSTGTSAPTISAFDGVWNRGEMRLIQLLPGKAPSREYEKASRAPAPWTAVPHEKNAMITMTRKKSCNHCGS